jgi:hypothetical protein
MRRWSVYCLVWAAAVAIEAITGFQNAGHGIVLAVLVVWFFALIFLGPGRGNNSY